MDALLKKYLWITNLFFLVIIAWLLAVTLNVVVEHKMRILPSMHAKPTSRPSFDPNEKVVKNYDIIVERNYFNPALSSDLELDETRAKKIIKEVVQSKLRASLVGTIVAPEHPEWSLAMITDLEASDTAAYRIDSQLMGEARVVSILSKRVIIDHNGSLEYLELLEKTEIKQVRRLTRRRPQEHASLGEGIKKTGASNWVIEREEIDKILTNLSTVSQGARIMPSFNGTQAEGFKLVSIRPKSIFKKLGLQNRDVIKKINGYPLDSLDKALEIFQKLKSARSIDIEITRRGKTKKLNYRIE
jgi:general secretion pathway protein C